MANPSARIDVAIDFETLSLKRMLPMLTAFGAYPFSFRDMRPIDKPFYRRFNIGEQIILGRALSQDTMSWWQEQSQEAQDATFLGENFSVHEVLTAFKHYLEQLQIEASNGGPLPSVLLWGHGAATDVSWFRNLCEDVGYPDPINYRDIRDTRTIYDSARTVNPVWDVPERPKHLTPHVAHLDAEYEAMCILSAQQELVRASVKVPARSPVNMSVADTINDPATLERIRQRLQRPQQDDAKARGVRMAQDEEDGKNE